MRPTRECGLVELLDKILDKGVVLNADVIISVAGVPLVGVSLRAALAGIETMLDYGIMEAWDQSIREHYSKELAKRKA
ncbi:MAG: gas vesicle protein GvpM [Hadesarchaea archaeon DG-33-1]|nr:MAG: gas vesicle protein GvpM [Hadesarchaea archaeon DG-33-1]